MAHKKPSLETLLNTSSGKKLLFLGRKGIFTTDEIANFLKKQKIEVTKHYEEDVVGVVEHHRLNPVEEELSNMAYENHTPLYTLLEFEKLLSEGIRDDELLMILKLSNDQERIFRLLGNEHISEELFIKLLMMYAWHDEEEDDRDDRDVIMYTLRRYIEIKPNEEDLLYSYLTLRRLATEVTQPMLLLALLGFPNFSFLIRGKEKVTLRETIARNRYLDNTVIGELVSLRDFSVDVALASNSGVGLPLLKKLLAKNSEAINEALTTNENIDNEIFNTLLAKEERIVQLLLWSQPIDSERLASVDAQGLDETLFATLGANERLEHAVVDSLMKRDSESLLSYLAANESLSAQQLEHLYAKGLLPTFEQLALNPSTPISILTVLYEKYETQEIRLALAHNTSTPEDILRALFHRDEFEIHQRMASNASLPMELLDLLKVDTRLQNELAKNEIFVKAYEAVFEYDANAIGGKIL